MMVTGAATTSCFLFIFEAEALCCGRVSLVVLGHGEVCFVTSSDGRGHEKGEKKKEKGEECKSYCCRPTGTLQKSSEGFILQRSKSKLLLISQGEGSGQEADGVIIGQQRTKNKITRRAPVGSCSSRVTMVLEKVFRREMLVRASYVLSSLAGYLAESSPPPCFDHLLAPVINSGFCASTMGKKIGA